MSHEIESAIILAAGRGSRMKAITDKPKSLLEVKGQVLIERLIEQLQTKGIKNIIIVTGYRHKDFYYLEDKYDVELVYNKKWFCTNNVVSFIKAFETCFSKTPTKGVLITDADIYINDINVIRTNIDSSGYYVEYSSDEDKCKTEWVVEFTGATHKCITNIVTDGSHEHGYILRSLSVWTPIDFMNLYKYAKEAVSDGSNMQCYIDDIPCNTYADKFRLEAYVAEKNSLLEFDTEQDYTLHK